MTKHWNHNIHYHSLIVSAVPSTCRRALDVGCGEGILTGELALSCRTVTGIDPDYDSLQRAIANNGDIANIDFVMGDVMTYPFQPESFDMITAVATLHHLPSAAALHRFRDLLAPKGVLFIIGLYPAQSVVDYAYTALGLPMSFILRRFKAYREIKAPMTEPLETLDQIKQTVKEILPGAVIRRCLLFRYSLQWVKP